jgi:hypothetical protein
MAGLVACAASCRGAKGWGSPRPRSGREATAHCLSCAVDAQRCGYSARVVDHSAVPQSQGRCEIHFQLDHHFDTDGIHMPAKIRHSRTHLSRRTQTMVSPAPHELERAWVVLSVGGGGGAEGAWLGGGSSTCKLCGATAVIRPPSRHPGPTEPPSHPHLRHCPPKTSCVGALSPCTLAGGLARAR